MRIASEELVFQRRQNRREHVAVNVVEEIDSEEQRQGARCGRFSLACHNTIAESAAAIVNVKEMQGGFSGCDALVIVITTESIGQQLSNALKSPNRFFHKQ
jgi:hypothetical protein